MIPILCSDWNERIVFAAQGPQPQILMENEKLKIIIAGLEPGQAIPAHPEALAVYHFLQGAGWMVVDDEKYPVRSGTTIVTPAGSSRGVEAETRLVFLATRIA